MAEPRWTLPVTRRWMAGAIALILVVGVLAALDRRGSIRLNPLAPEVEVTKRATRAPVVWTADWPTLQDPPQSAAHFWYLNDDLSRPAVADGVLYATGRDGRLRAVDARSGRELWVFGSGSPYVTNFRMAGDRIVAVVKADDEVTRRARNSLVVIDRRSGLPVATVPMDDLILDESLVVVGETMFVGVQDNLSFNEHLEERRRAGRSPIHPRVVSVALDGRTLWTADLTELSGDNPLRALYLLPVGDLVVASKRHLYGEHDLEALRVADGSAAWSHVSVTDPFGVRREHVWNGRILLLNGGSGMSVVDATTGRLDKELSLAALIGRASVDETALDGDMLYVVADGDHVSGIDVRDWDVRWETTTGYRKSVIGSTYPDTRLPSVQSGLLYLGGRDASVYAVDGRTGKIRYRFETSPPPGSLTRDFSPVAVDDLVIVIDSEAVAYRPDR